MEFEVTDSLVNHYYDRLADIAWENESKTCYLVGFTCNFEKIVDVCQKAMERYVAQRDSIEEDRTLALRGIVA